MSRSLRANARRPPVFFSPAEGAARCIDCALISKGMAPCFDEPELIREVPWKPRIGLRLELNGGPRQLKGRVLRRPAVTRALLHVEKMPRSRAACRRAARGEQKALRRRRDALAESGISDGAAEEYDQVPQLYDDEEVQRVIADIWQDMAARVVVGPLEELPQHLQGTIVGNELGET